MAIDPLSDYFQKVHENKETDKQKILKDPSENTDQTMRWLEADEDRSSVCSEKRLFPTGTLQCFVRGPGWTTLTVTDWMTQLFRSFHITENLTVIDITNFSLYQLKKKEKEKYLVFAQLQQKVNTLKYAISAQLPLTESCH